jgi:NAD-dependent deacetylase
MHEAVMLAELIRANQPCVALTGAGVSTESGIPDFRSASGIWAQYDPAEVASIDGFRRDPERVWEFYGRRLAVLDAAEPNTGHLALAELERASWIAALVTQNVDRLHERGGSLDLVEVHGSLRSATCLACGGGDEPMEEAAARLPVPLCRVCGAILKPGVVLFGEQLPAAAIDRAAALATGAALLLVVGSSLEVWPVAGLPETTLAHGGKLAIVNHHPTVYDDRAELVIHASAGAVLSGAVSALANV